MSDGADVAAFLAARLDEEYLSADRFRNDSDWDVEMLARLFRRSESDPVIWHLARHDPGPRAPRDRS